MIDEIIEYMFAKNKEKGMDDKDAIYKVCVIVANMTDTELRDTYKNLVSHDKEWVEKHQGEEIDYTKSIASRIKDYPIKLSPAEIKEIRKNPENILQPVFNGLEK